jgi:DNA-binding response OmpR family regulator
MEDAHDRPVVLVAEDDDDIRSLLVFGLWREGYRVVEAGDGLEALRAVTAERPALVILDIAMPRLDGLAVCRILQSKGAEAPPVIFLTAAAHPRQRVEGLDLGAVDYVTKPFDQTELMARVRAALRTTEKLRELERDIVVSRALPALNMPRSGATSNLRHVPPGLVD